MTYRGEPSSAGHGLNDYRGFAGKKLADTTGYEPSIKVVLAAHWRPNHNSNCLTGEKLLYGFGTCDVGGKQDCCWNRKAVSRKGKSPRRRPGLSSGV